MWAKKFAAPRTAHDCYSFDPWARDGHCATPGVRATIFGYDTAARAAADTTIDDKMPCMCGTVWEIDNRENKGPHAHPDRLGRI